MQIGNNDIIALDKTRTVGVLYDIIAPKYTCIRNCTTEAVSVRMHMLVQKQQKKVCRTYCSIALDKSGYPDNFFLISP